jgi:hypothetical protein
MTASFVQTLAIASDPRLPRLRSEPVAETGGTMRAAPRSRPGPAVRRELVGESARAAVIKAEQLPDIQ